MYTFFFAIAKSMLRAGQRSSSQRDSIIIVYNVAAQLARAAVRLQEVTRYLSSWMVFKARDKDGCSNQGTKGVIYCTTVLYTHFTLIPAIFIRAKHFDR